MKAIVTGGAGFIGSHLAAALLSSGARVTIIDNLSTGRQSNVPEGAVLHALDVASDEAYDLIVHERPEVVFHLAGQANVHKSMTDPVYDARTNVLGTLNLLTACKRACAAKFIFSSTAAVYGSTDRDRLTESDPVSPVSFYALSKWFSEQYIHLFAELNQLPYTILRFSNVYGPRQMPQGEGNVIPLFMNQLRRGQPIMIHGDGNQTRDFVYVGDVVKALLSASLLGRGGTYHVSTGQSISVNELAQQLIAIHGSDHPIVHTASRAGDTEHSCLDNHKASQELLWRPMTSFDDGLREAYAYFMR
ncbi:UDP-glucose 4-epimerase [Paenibacillus cellulosilyticus]|uniref:UDP-glucose 4-epimerase n=1 Tax=Paenibacillus cellulosilyticus TaxID=375489 RepID=A0A2V2YN27_9BACL|nr:NAD-dependent epimerase/dehydratase family protein [Paenibacillus cellulosilyticus]PWV95238.1 UDP-glucose 4-epimerase [Paenibacillus cellulosilyticus]QKS46016.1 GDP-mannose 4,6-dehydratase [Paenibacillus cellulosilyticus]